MGYRVGFRTAARYHDVAAPRLGRPFSALRDFSVLDGDIRRGVNCALKLDDHQ
jgi:hypothetical protein